MDKLICLFSMCNVQFKILINGSPGHGYIGDVGLVHQDEGVESHYD